MKLRHLFDLATDVSDVLDFFENVTDPQQMASRLERLRKGDAPEALLACVEGMRSSLAQLMDDNIEASGSFDDGSDAEPDPDLDTFLNNVASEEVEKNPSQPETPAEEDTTPDVTST